MKKFTSWLKDLFTTDAARIEKGRKIYLANDLSVPKNLNEFPNLSGFFNRISFTAPRTVDLRDYCAMTSNQGDRPWCAAYSAAGWAKNILWRKNDTIFSINEADIYRCAKRIDGDPNGEGTSLTAVMQILLDLKYFDKNICQIQVITNGPGFEETIKYAVHKFGCLIIGCNITEEWYLCGPKKTCVTGLRNNKSVGGHAVLCCGYNRDGIIIQNSWGEDWGSYGFGLISWHAVRNQFIYGAVLTNCLNNFRVNGSNTVMA